MLFLSAFSKARVFRRILLRNCLKSISCPSRSVFRRGFGVRLRRTGFRGFVATKTPYPPKDRPAKGLFRQLLKRLWPVVFLLLILPSSFTHAQGTEAEDAVLRRQAELEAELETTNKDIAYWAEILAGKQTETASLSRDIGILTAKIAEAKAKIKAKNIVIEQLGKVIGNKISVIDSLDKKIERQKVALSDLVRRANEIESYSAAELFLSGRSFSEFFSDLDSYASIQEALKGSFEEIRATREQTETEKEELGRRQDAEVDARKIIESEQRQIQKNETAKKGLLAINKNQEKAYQGIVKDRQAKAAKIRSALFALRDSAAIPFGTAFGYALEVEKKTGIRPAFLLAILTQESNLGENVGQCLLTNLTTGAGVGKNTGAVFKSVMKPDRDVPVFIDLASRLGFDPKQRSVSCPQKGGYGGAMGPSQFIPSTWVLYEKKIGSAAGEAVPNPWIPRDAFFASGIYLADLGATGGNYSAESRAAAKYYAGSAWKTRGAGYAASVMKHAENIQENMIDPLQNV